MERVASHGEGASVATLTRETDLPRATVTRLLASLADAGAVVRSPHSKSWTLGPTIVRLAQALGGIVELRERGRPILEELTQSIGETVMLAVPAGPASAQVITEVEGRAVVSARAAWTGQLLTEPTSGFVRLVLAELPEDDLKRALRSMPVTVDASGARVTPQRIGQAIRDIQRDQVCVVVDELELGLAGVAVPVRRRGTLVAMLATYLPTARFDAEMLDRTVPVLREAAARLV